VTQRAGATDPEPAVVRVLIDEAAIQKEFDYAVPASMAAQVEVGTMVRVALGPRRVGGWVTAVGVTPPDGVMLRPLAKVTGHGPSPEVIELSRWAAWRWAGRVAPLLVTASPPGAVVGLPPRAASVMVPGPADAAAAAWLAGARIPRAGVLRLPPASDPLGVVLAAMALGDTLVVAPSVDQARTLAARIRRAGPSMALVPRDWARAAAGGCSVIGSRASAFAPCPDLAAVVVLDEHDEALKEERTPAYHARDVAIERARRAGVPCLMVSPCPSLEALNVASLITLSRTDERAGWPIVDIIDRSRDLPSQSGPVSERLARALHSDGRAVCVLNRAGTARLLACRACATLARCERCGASVSSDGPVSSNDPVSSAGAVLRCRRCSTERPTVCLHCGSTRLVNRRPGVSRIRADLEAMLNEPVAEITAASPIETVHGERVLIGTEAVLHRIGEARTVAFIDIDDELLAPRYRAGEQALALLARAARLVGGRSGGGRIMVQTRLPHHEVLEAVLFADPARLAAAEEVLRRELRFPPITALATVEGPVAAEFVDGLRAASGSGSGSGTSVVEVLGPFDGRYLLRAENHQGLCDALSSAPRPAGRLRIEVDPLRV
jgi:primosomal protein N' (replication factor Y) (superfamily II helicase)